MKTYKKTDKQNELGQWIIEIEETREDKKLLYRTPLELEAMIKELEDRILVLKDELKEVKKLQ